MVERMVGLRVALSVELKVASKAGNLAERLVVLLENNLAAQ